MAHFSNRSKLYLFTCHRDLQLICNEAIKYYDFSVICGHRGEDAQLKAFKDGKSNRMWPASYHNEDPSDAIDICPYPIDWNNINRFFELHGVILAVAGQLNIEIEWGGFWNSIKDYPHYQLKRK